MAELDYSIRVSGPVAEGRQGAIVARSMPEFAHAVAQDALAEVHANLDASLRNPTPYYETQIVNDRRGADEVVHDRGIVYGPWLEGVGSRNRTTRFKGYFSFRRARQAVQERVPATVDRVLRDLVRRLN